MYMLSNDFNIVKIIELHPSVVLVIYCNNDSKTNDVVLIKNKSQGESLSVFNSNVIKTISYISMRRKNKKRTEIMTFELEQDLFNAVTNWCNSLKVSFEQLAYAFVEFICINKNSDVVISWIKEMKCKRY